jgi:non-ribosomal peptide synthetase-like protein
MAQAGLDAINTQPRRPPEARRRDSVAPVAPVAPVDRGCLHELFEAQVDRAPDDPALLCGEETLSYRELEARSNRLARALRDRGAGPGKLVGLYLERSARPIVAVLACLKAGAAYVPIDPIHPGERVRHILGEAEITVLVTEGALAARAAALFEGPLVDLDDRAGELLGQSPERLSGREIGVCPADLCYVIYTSGTTGRPKGVMTEHGSVRRFVHAFNEVCGLGPGDRVYQGFLLGFDGSVEEMWMAFSNGSALVVGDARAPRFGDELGELLARSGVTYLSTVPTVLTTLSGATSIPTLRLLVVSGEICPPELVNRWARAGLRMLNVYGPTEATVNTTAAECRAGRPVTIGRPLRGYELHVLDERMIPVPEGEKGELYVGGETLARGYLKQPELTAERFVPGRAVAGAASARFYRTGDIVRRNGDGELEFFGRIDGQIKLRGHRVELAEIESVLLEHPGIRAASARVFERDGLARLAACVVLRDASAPLDRGEVLARLEARLPPYMIPGFLDVVAELPTLGSGKVDRGRLPAPISPLVREGGALRLPESELEARIAAVWAKVLGLPRVSIDDDFFRDLGGHSLVAAQGVTALRAALGRTVDVRDAYDFPTIRGLARHLAARPAVAPPAATRGGPTAAPSSRAVFEGLPRGARLGTATLQALSMYFLHGLVAVPLGGLILLTLGVLRGHVSPSLLVGLAVATALLAWPALLALSVAAKWLVLGRYRPGEHPLWGFYYFRFWLVTTLQGLSGAGALAGTPLMPLYFRLMGARVGHRCTLDTALAAAWDLVTIGDDTSIGADTQLLGYRVEDGKLVLGRVDIGRRCFIGVHSALGLSVRMGDDARLDDQSLLPDGQAIGPGEAWRGSPARPAPVAVPEGAPGPSSRRRRALFAAAHLALLELSGLLLLVPAVLVLGLWGHAFLALGIPLGMAALIASVPAVVALYCVFLAGLKRLVLGRAEPGVHPVESVFYLRKWLSDELMKLSRSLLLPVYTTLYLPPWLRLLGARIGARAELSTLWYFAPELTCVGEESFCADGSILGGKRLFRGLCEVGVSRVGRRSFVGNSAVLPVGAGLGDGCLLGVQSIPPAGEPRTEDGTEWLGSPAFALRHRPRLGGFDDTVTFRPTRRLYLQRAAVDALRILLPAYLGLAALGGYAAALQVSFAHLGAAATLALAPLLAIALGLASTLAVVAIKKVAMGTFQPVIKPLWSTYVWLNEMVNGVYESVMARAIAPFLGTPFVAPLLRLLGCKIGRHVYVATTHFSEFDLVEVGDHAALNLGAVIQNHLFEDRVMKSSRVTIGPECSVGNMAVVLYDSAMERGAALGPLSLLMKGEALAPGGRRHGIPTAAAPARPA